MGDIEFMKKLNILIILILLIVPVVCGFVWVDDSLHCDIQYELNGGENSPQNQTRYDKSSGIIYLENPEKEGSDFFGWYTSPTFEEDTKVTEFDPETMGDVTLYAKFVAYVDYVGNTVVSITEYGRTKSEIAIPKSCVKIGDYAFKNATNLTKITTDGCGNLEKIGIGSFSGCTSLEYLGLPASLKEIGIMAFDYETLKVVEISNANETFEMVDGSIVKITDKTLVALGSNKIPDGIEIIGEYALFKNEEIKSVVVPATVREILSHAFANCHNLETITFENGSNLQIVGKYAFGYCYKLQEIKLPDTVKTISGGAFANCKSMRTFTFPSSIEMKVVEGSTFYGCENLEEITLPNSVTKIERDAFANCKSLESVVIPETVKEIDGDSFRDCVNLKQAIYLGSGEWKIKPFMQASMQIDQDLISNKESFAMCLRSNYIGTNYIGNTYARFEWFRV